MARIEYPGPDDPTAQAAHELAMGMGLLIMAKTDRVNVALTAICQALGSVMSFIPESEFESTLGCITESVRRNRAMCAPTPTKNELN